MKSYLVDKGVDGSKIDAEGMGKANPVTKPGECGEKRSKATIACLQPDRRVEIEVSGLAPITHRRLFTSPLTGAFFCTVGPCWIKG